MESAAHPCLDSLHRQVHMTFLSQAEPSCCDLVKCVTSCGRNCVENVKRNGWEQHATVLAGGLVQKRSDRAYTHRPAGAVCFSERSVSLCCSYYVRHKAVEKKHSCATRTLSRGCTHPNKHSQTCTFIINSYCQLILTHILIAMFFFKLTIYCISQFNFWFLHS